MKHSADISDNLAILQRGRENIECNWDEILDDDELRTQTMYAMSVMASMGSTIELLLRFGEIWLSDDELETLENIRKWLVTSLEELNGDTIR